MSRVRATFDGAWGKGAITTGPLFYQTLKFGPVQADGLPHQISHECARAVLVRVSGAAGAQRSYMRLSYASLR